MSCRTLLPFVPAMLRRRLVQCATPELRSQVPGWLDSAGQLVRPFYISNSYARHDEAIESARLWLNDVHSVQRNLNRKLVGADTIVTDVQDWRVLKTSLDLCI